MQDNEKKPALRFKGFTDPWEQRKLGEIAFFSKGLGYSKNDLCEEGTPIILYGRLYTKYETCIFDVDTFVKEKAGGVYSKGGEVIVPASGETAEDISIASVVVKPGILLGGDLNIVSPTAEYDSAFLALTISSGATHKYLSSLAQGKSVVHLHNADIQSVSAKFPTKREQEKIHLLFGKIDTLITLHQRKYEKLVNIKKSMLDKMFPKNGASVPEIRFKGFTDPWEQRKLGDISEIKTGPFGSTLHADDYVSDGIPIITTEHFKTGSLPTDKYGLPQVSENDFSRLSAYILNAGDIVFSRVGSVDINALITPFQSTWLFSGRVLRVRPQNKNSSQFLHTLLETEDVKNDIRTRAVGQTMPSINTEILKTTPLRLPESTLEQEQLGKYFLNLDTLITLHQRKLEKLQNIKKSCLEKMFV